jgi:predicted translin family RNA/ssDNA-binding protein
MPAKQRASKATPSSTAKTITSKSTTKLMTSKSTTNVAAAATILDKADFAAMRKDLAEYDATRDRIIKESRDITAASKHAIYSMQRGDLGEATRQIAQAETVIKRLLPLTKLDPHLRGGSFSQSLEEYAEACLFYGFLATGTLPRRADIGVLDADEYLLGLCDLTGELVRWGVLRGTARDIAGVRAARDLVDAILGELLQFDLRNGELRKKYDGVKYSLQKLEQVLYDLRDD